MARLTLRLLHIERCTWEEKHRQAICSLPVSYSARPQALGLYIVIFPKIF